MDQHKNFAYSTVATAPSPAASGTSLAVNPGDGPLFPTPPFNATVWPIGSLPLGPNAEIVRVTASVGDSFGTIVRQQEGTNPRTIVAGDQIMAAPTVKTFTDIESAAPPPSRVILDDHCDSATLPPGVTISGGTSSFDSTRLGRILTGSGTSAIYTGPAAALNGPLIFEVEFEFRNAYGTGNVQIYLKRGDNGNAFNWIGQTDGNLVLYKDVGGATTAVSGINHIIDQQRWRASHVLSDLGDGALGNAVTFASIISEGFGRNNNVVAYGGKFAVGAALAAGTLLTPIIQADPARSIELYRVRFYRGTMPE